MTLSRIFPVVAMALLVGVGACASEDARGDEEAPATSGESALVGGCDPDRLIANAPADKKDILRRAAKWVRSPVPYSMEAWKDGHRTDCSGFVSMAWGIGDIDTSMIPPRDPDSHIAHAISWSDLQVGDAVARGPWPGFSVGHVMLYAGEDYLGFGCYWEQTHGGTQVSSVIKATLTGSYTAIRRGR